MSDSGYTASDKGVKDDGKSMVATIASMQDYDRYRDLSWDGSFEDYLAHRPRAPAGDAQRLPARLRHDHLLRDRGVHRQQEEARSATTSSATKRDGGRDAIFGLDIPLMRLVNVLQGAAQGLRHREARHPAARPGRLLQVHHRAPAQEGPRGLLRARAEGALYTFTLGQPARARGTRQRRSRHASPARCTRSRCSSSRASGASKAHRASSASPTTSYTVRVDGELDPACRFIFQRADGRSYDGDWAKVDRNHVRVRRLVLSARRTASASAPSSPRTRRTRTRPS